MSIKSFLQNLINTKLASGSDITAVELREVEDALLLNSYGTTINETQTTNTITSENTANPLIQYNIFICKQGRKVTIKGNLVNNSPLIIGGESSYFFEIVNSEYAPSLAIEGVGGIPTICATQSGNSVSAYLYNSKLCVESLGAFEIVYLNFEYLTEN